MLMESIISAQELGVVNISEGRTIRVYYELAVLRKVRKELRCKNIWIKDFLKYCDPEQDFTSDFYNRKKYYCDLLNLDTVRDVEEVSKVKHSLFRSDKRTERDYRISSQCSH